MSITCDPAKIADTAAPTEEPFEEPRRKRRIPGDSGGYAIPPSDSPEYAKLQKELGLRPDQPIGLYKPPQTG